MNIKRIPLAVVAFFVACAALAYLVGSFRPFSSTEKFSNNPLPQNNPPTAPATRVVIYAPTQVPTRVSVTVRAVQVAQSQPTPLPPPTETIPVPPSETAPPTATRRVIFVAQSRPTATPTEFFQRTRIAQVTGTPTPTELSPEEAFAATQTSVPAQQTVAAIATRAFSTPATKTLDPTRAINKTTNFLLIGTDSRTTDPNWVPNTDVMMVLFLDTANQRAALFSLPRDLVVAIPGKQAFRINSAYYQGWESGGVEGGVDVLKQVLKNEFDVRIDHWALIDFDGLSKIIDVLGGIEVDVPCALTDTIDEQTFTIPAGLVQMDYLTSKRYVQSRYTTSDTSRNHRQQRVVWAIAKKALGLNAPDRVPFMYARLQENIATDMSLFDMIGLIPAVYQMDLQNYPERLRARVLEAPAVYPWVSTSGAWLYMPNYDEIKKELDEIFDSPQIALSEASPAECPLRPATPIPTDAPTATVVPEATPATAETSASTETPIEVPTFTPVPTEVLLNTAVPESERTATVETEVTPDATAVPSETPAGAMTLGFPTFTPQPLERQTVTAAP